MVVKGGLPGNWLHASHPVRQGLLHLWVSKEGDIADFTPPPVEGVRPDAGDLNLDCRCGVVGLLDGELQAVLG
eukprot:9644927-Alexandrium_andersonii.AAC.1